MAHGNQPAGRRTAGWMILGLAALLQGCAQSPPPAPAARLFASDLSGSAKACDVGKVSPAAGQTAPVTMKLGNDGGWCAITVNDGGKPFAAGLLSAPPAHGKVLIHTVGDDTRIDYTPQTQFTGPDSFSVQLLPGSATLNVSVTVTGR